MQMMAERITLAVIERVLSQDSLFYCRSKTSADTCTQLVCALWLCMTIDIGANLWIMSLYFFTMLVNVLVSEPFCPVLSVRKYIRLQTHKSRLTKVPFNLLKLITLLLC